MILNLRLPYQHRQDQFLVNELPLMSSERPELERIFVTVSLEELVKVDEQCKSTLRDAYSTGYVCQLSTNVRTYPISKILHNYFLHFLLGHEDVPKRIRKKCRCKFLERKRGVLWDLCKKRIHEFIIS